MLLSHLIIALSLLFVPLAVGRPASTPSHNSSPPSASSEPNALLGRHYLVHEHREAAYTRSVPATKASPDAQRTPRHMKPFARYIADRSGDTWMHESRRAPIPILIPRAPADDEPRRKYVNYVSHVGPFAYDPPPPPPLPSIVTVTVLPQPSPTFAQDFVSASNSTVGLDPEATASVLNLATTNATTTPTPDSTDPSPTASTMAISKGKRVRAKVRAKLHKSGKKRYRERRRS